MGKSGVGKTSMRSIIFANYVAVDTNRLGVTVDVEHSQFKLLGNLLLHIWDCGGQQSFMENYLTINRTSVFSEVEILIYVFDINSNDVEDDMYQFKRCFDNLKSYSKDAKLICLVHKIDLIRHDPKNQQIVDKRMDLIEKTVHTNDLILFATSIWNDSLYLAWNDIVQTLIPHKINVNYKLEQFRRLVDASEVYLFERNSMLILGKSLKSESVDAEISIGLSKRGGEDTSYHNDSNSNTNLLDGECDDMENDDEYETFDENVYDHLDTSVSSQVKLPNFPPVEKSDSSSSGEISRVESIEDVDSHVQYSRTRLIPDYYGSLCHTEDINLTIKKFTSQCIGRSSVTQITFKFGDMRIFVNLMTPNIYIFVVLNNHHVSNHLLNQNIYAASFEFEELERLAE